jgi:hypothetical protein
LDFIDPWDLVVLADSSLPCRFGEVVESVRVLFRRRRSIILSTPWLGLEDLGSLVAAYLTVDPVISREAHRYIDKCIKVSRTGRRTRLAQIDNLS